MGRKNIANREFVFVNCNITSFIKCLLISPVFIIYAQNWWGVYIYVTIWLISLLLWGLFYYIDKNFDSNIILDHLFLWLLSFFILVLILDYINQDFVTQSGNLLVTIIACMFVIVFGITKREFLLLALLATMQIHILQLLNYGMSYVFVRDHSLSLIPILASFYLFLEKKYKYSLIFILLALPIATRGVLLAIVSCIVAYYLFKKIRLHKTSVIRSVLLVSVLMIVSVQIIIGSNEIIAILLGDVSTGRSYFYYTLVTNMYESGVNLFFPISNYYATDVVGQYKFLIGEDKFGLTNCPHSMYIEILQNYGLLFASILIISLVMAANARNWSIVLFFLIVSGLQCGYLVYNFFVPIYIVYRLLSVNKYEIRST